MYFSVSACIFGLHSIQSISIAFTALQWYHIPIPNWGLFAVIQVRSWQFFIFCGTQSHHWCLFDLSLVLAWALLEHSPAFLGTCSHNLSSHSTKCSQKNGFNLSRASILWKLFLLHTAAAKWGGGEGAEGGQTLVSWGVPQAQEHGGARQTSVRGCHITMRKLISLRAMSVALIWNM